MHASPPVPRRSCSLFSTLALLLVLPALRANFPAGTPVSPLLIGQNFWLNPPDSAYPIIRESGVKLMRIGGITYDNNPLSDAALLHQVDNIRAIGAEPMIQVSRHKGAPVAAATLTYLNVTHRRNVKFWCIGNEPDMNWPGTESALAEHVAGYIKEYAQVLRDIDPGIHISAADMAFYSATKFQSLVGGAADITGRDPKGRFYVDCISFHRYPFAANFSRANVLAEMRSGFESRVTALQGHVAAANALHRRSGTEALTWSLTEFNLTYSNPPVSTNQPTGLGVRSFLNGQFFADYYRVGMKHGALTLAAWSLQEGGGAGGTTDFGYIGGSWAAPIRRSSFHHMKLVADYLLPGGYLPGSSSVPHLSVLCTSTSSQSVLAVLLMNQETAVNQPFTLRLNEEPATGPGARVNVSAGLAREFSGTLGSQSTVVLRFDSSGTLQQRITYSLNHYLRNLPPSVENFPVFTRAPAAPSGLTAMSGEGRVVLHWNGSGATGYTLWRATTGEGPFISVARGVMASPYIDYGLTPGTAYVYRVTAENPVGESPPSLSATATPFSPLTASSQWEAESLPFVATGSSFSINTETAASGGSWVQLNATEASPFLEFTTPSLPAGTYQLTLGYKANPNRGQLRVTVDGNPVGGLVDQYASTTRFTTIGVGEVRFDQAGAHTLRLTVAGKNEAATAFLISADQFILGAAEAAEIRLDGLSAVFNGSPRAVTVTTLPAGLATQVTYNGSPTPPTAPGQYSIVATLTHARYIASTSGTLEIIATRPESSRLSNVAVRTTLAARQILTVGLTMQGGGKSVLFRAAGPSLAPFGVPDAMADPAMALFENTSPIASNDNWGGNSAVVAAAAAVGAFDFSSGGSLDAALVAPVDGGRTLQVSGPASGSLLVEAYDAGSGDMPRLTNLSALNSVGPGNSVLIAGFTITGTGTQTTLLRAVGPSLSSLGVSGVLVDPKLELFTAGGAAVKIAGNDHYSTTLVPVFASVGAFPLRPGARDAALLVSLPAGGYTVHASSADGTAGLTLVEVYALP